MTISYSFSQGSSGLYTTALTKTDGTALGASSLTSLTLTLQDQATAAVINSRSAQDVLNVNGVTVDASGNLTWTVTPSDNVILDSTLTAGNRERHVATFTATWATGTKVWTVDLDVISTLQPPPATICSVEECLLWLGKRSTATQDDKDLVQEVLLDAEAAIRKHIGCTLSYGTYVHLLPAQQSYTNQDPLILDYDVKNGRVQSASFSTNKEQRELLLPEKPVRKVLEVRCDYGAFGGSAPGDLSNATVIKQGLEFWVEYEQMDPTLPIASASCDGTTVTIVTTSAHALSIGDPVSISDVTNASYTGSFAVASVPATNSFTYTVNPGGLASSSGGWVQPLRGICRSGRMTRIAIGWPARARTVRVTYAAGYTADELRNGIGRHIRSAIKKTVQWLFSRRGDTPGQVTSESEGGWSASYAILKVGRLPRDVVKDLQSEISYDRFL